MEQSKKKTAIEWLESEINKYIDYYEGKRNAMPYSLTHLQNAILQAKQMEKEQIKEAYNHGWDDREYEVEDSWKKDADEKYFNETYGQ
jgi:hypothetical protein